MIIPRCLLAWCVFQVLIVQGNSRVLDFAKDFESIPFDKSYATCLHNAELLNKVLNESATGNVIVFPVNMTWHLFQGMVAREVNDTILQLDGTLRFEKGGSVGYGRECLTITKSRNLTITSKHRGVVDGRGSQYWGIPFVGYAQRRENRPRLLRFDLTEDLVIENIVLQDSPYHTLYLDAVNRVEVRNVSIVARRTSHDGHGILDMTAFNTDGIDVSGSNVWVHDCDIWVQDDCIAVKDVRNHSLEGIAFTRPVSSNMTFERINATGIGFTIGSILATHVKNITFRNSYLHRPFKGIYMKFARRQPWAVQNNTYGLVEDVLYENITMEGPSQWPIWIGPAQQADNIDICHPNPCSLCWPMVPGSKCHVVPGNKFRNITLRNILINNPKISPGVVYGSHEDSIDNLVFEDVLVTTGGMPLPYAQAKLSETFPGTTKPIHDAYVPRFVANAQRGMDWFGDKVHGFILKIREAIAKTRGMYKFAAYNLVQNGGGAEQWYLSVILQSVLGFVWWWLLLALLMFVFTISVLRHWTRFSRFVRDDDGDGDYLGINNRSKRILYHFLYATLFLVFLFSALCCLVFLVRKPKWQRTDQYYACEGAKGVARGNTLPLPTCLELEGWRWPSTFSIDEINEASPAYADTVVMDSTALILLCLGFVMVVVAHCKISFHEQLELRTRSGEEAENSPSLRQPLLWNVGNDGEDDSPPLVVEVEQEDSNCAITQR